jgi:hypothetical protein
LKGTEAFSCSTPIKTAELISALDEAAAKRRGGIPPGQRSGPTRIKKKQSAIAQAKRAVETERRNKSDAARSQPAAKSGCRSCGH